MSFTNDANVTHALELVSLFLQSEKSNSDTQRRTNAIRRLIQLSSEPDLVRRRCITAAFGLIAAELDPTADDIAWLVRDRDIGFPEQASFAV